MKAQPVPASATTVVQIAAVAQQLHADEARDDHSHGARTLVRESDLRVVLLAFAPGAKLAQHHVKGSATVQVIDGMIEVGIDGQVIELHAGQLLPIARGVAHDVVAVARSTVLLTLAQLPG